MQQYEVLKTIMLSFLTPQDQYDAMINAGCTIKSDGTTIWLSQPDGKWVESITMAYAIKHWLVTGVIREVSV